MSPAFSTRPRRANPRLAKDSPFNFHPPPLIWRKGSSQYVPTCTMSPGFSTRPYRANPRLAKDSPFNFHPPLQNNHGSFVILSSKENQKNTIWRKGSSHYVPTCTMSPGFSTRPYRANPRLAKDSPLNFHPPPPKQPRVLCHLVF